MKLPSPHPQERMRIKALESLNILDTLAEKEFDDIANLASQICDTPIAIISFVHSSRQWFKSKVGLDLTETPKNISLCAHAILQDEMFIVPDLQKNIHFFDHPLTAAPYAIQFYAGAQLIDSRSKLPLGTLCVLDNKPKLLTAQQIESLQILAHQVCKLLELRIQVSDLKKANQTLELQKIEINNLSEGIVLQDCHGQVVDYNSAVLSVLGISSAELLESGIPYQSLKAVDENDIQLEFESHPEKQALLSGCRQSKLVGIKTTLGEAKWLSISANPIFLQSEQKPTYTMITVIDITQLHFAQLALVESAKLCSLGEMAGGVAHEINTPLAIICSASSQALTLLEKPSEDRLEKVKKNMVKIETTGKRIAQIIRGLKTLSRDSAQDPLQENSLQQMVADAVALCAEKFKHKEVEVKLCFNQDFIILCNPTQVSQVLLNLLSNSNDALSECESKWIRIDVEKQDSRVRLKFIDSGCGIPKAVQLKMMEPFFTTKQAGKGTGLGLSISKSIIESFNGRLYYDEKCKNTCFVVELPFEKAA